MCVFGRGGGGGGRRKMEIASQKDVCKGCFFFIHVIALLLIFKLVRKPVESFI